MFQTNVFLQVHQLTCGEVTLIAVNPLSVVNNADMSLQVVLGGRLKLAPRMSAHVTNTIVNSFDVLTKFSFPFALVLAFVTSVNNSQVFSLVVHIELRFTFAFVAANIAHLYHIQVDNFDVVQKNALTPHFDTTVLTCESHTQMLSFGVVLKSICCHTHILASILLTHMRVLLMDMAEVPFQVEFASCFELAPINRALVAAVAVLGFHVTLQCLTCVRLVITFTTLQFDF